MTDREARRQSSSLDEDAGRAMDHPVDTAVGTDHEQVPAFVRLRDPLALQHVSLSV